MSPHLPENVTLPNKCYFNGVVRQTLTEFEENCGGSLCHNIYVCAGEPLQHCVVQEHKTN